MKLWIVILFTIAGSVSIDCFSDAYLARIKTFVDQCQANPVTRVPEDWLDLTVLGRHADEAGPHILCRLKKVGSIKENGDIDVEALRKDLQEALVDTSKVEEAVNKCSKKESNWTAEKTAIENYKCVLSFK
uniref:Odorant-binding protein 3 n=1 Tax=Pyrrhalta aenescens TaxID=281545 RepID=A0A1J0KKL7_9CUCU|nr:odorant-binding protein 3 [Pyrrhalta aenescens]